MKATGDGDSDDAEGTMPSSGDAALRAEVRDYYRRLLPLLDRSLQGRGDRALWRDLAAEWGNGGILEIGAGSGRITELLAAGGRRVVGVDVSLDMLRRARTRLEDVPGTSLVAADMRSLRLGRRFRLVAAASDPLSHLRSGPDRDRTLAAAARHLAPEGRFVLDALWLSEERRREAAAPGGRVVERTTSEPSDRPALRTRETWRCDPESCHCRVEYEYRAGGPPLRASFRGRFWTREEVERRFPRAGLRVDALWGGYTREPWRPEASRMIVVARTGAT